MSSEHDPIERSAEAAVPDAGEPQGARDDRPAMLGRRFRQVIAASMLAGLVIALGLHGLLGSVSSFGSGNSWGWLIAALGGLAVGGAFGLFVYGAATDRSDTGPKPRGRADVREQGEWRRTLARRYHR